jgi:hypothetical protein
MLVSHLGPGAHGQAGGRVPDHGRRFVVVVGVLGAVPYPSPFYPSLPTATPRAAN